MCGDDRGRRPAPHIGDKVGCSPQTVLFAAAGAQTHPSVHERPNAGALPANADCYGLAWGLRLTFHLVVGYGSSPNSPQPTTPFRRLGNVPRSRGGVGSARPLGLEAGKRSSEGRSAWARRILEAAVVIRSVHTAGRADVVAQQEAWSNPERLGRLSLPNIEPDSFSLVF